MVPDLKTSYLPKTKYITEHVVYRRENFAHRVIAPGRVFFRRLIKHSVANRAKHKIVGTRNNDSSYQYPGIHSDVEIVSIFRNSLIHKNVHCNII